MATPSSLSLVSSFLFKAWFSLFTLLFTFGIVGAAEIGNAQGTGKAPASAFRPYGNSWAVVIGVNRYTKAPRLNYSVNDAKSVVAALQKLDFPADKILLLLDREATKQRVEQLLYGTLRRATPEDRVFVFFAGHGVTAALPRGGEEGYLLPVDGDPDDLPLTAIAMDDLRKIARRIPAKHILFTVDSCYSGFAISRAAGEMKFDARYLESVTKEPATQIITAGRKGEEVLEEEGHGLFTRRLLSGLSGLADIDQNGVITAQELATWLESRVVRDSQDRQHPQYSRLDGEGQFVFIVPGRERPAAPAIVDEGEKLKRELKLLAEERERLKREAALLEEQKRIHEEKQKLELAKLELERARLKAEAEQIALQKTQTEQARREAEQRQKAVETARAELAKLEVEEKKVKADEERLSKGKTEIEQARLKAERKKSAESAPPVVQPQAVAKLPPTPALSAAPIPKSAEIPQYGVGDSWTIRFADGRVATRSVRAIEKDLYVFEWGLDLLRYYDQNLVLRKQMTPEDEKEVFTSLLKQRTMDFPLSVNKAWEFRVFIASGKARRGDPVRWWRVFSFKVLGAETIQTPAGTFGAFKIEENSYETACVGAGPCDTIEDTSTVRHLWYSPVVKAFIKVRLVKGEPGEEQDLDYNLIAYRLS